MWEEKAIVKAAVQMTSSTTHARGARFLGTQLLWKADYKLQKQCISVTTAITRGILQARGGKRVRADTVCADDDTAGRKNAGRKGYAPSWKIFLFSRARILSKVGSLAKGWRVRATDRRDRDPSRSCGPSLARYAIRAGADRTSHASHSNSGSTPHLASP